MNTTDDKKLIARWALALFILGLLVPVIICLFAPFEVAAVFGVLAEVLALVLGIIGWRELCGKIATLGVVVLIAWSGVTFGFYSAARQRAMEVEQHEATGAHH